MANKDNLKNWKKGQSGNPSGRPSDKKYSGLTQALRKIGFETDPDETGRDASYYEVAARVWWWNACHAADRPGPSRRLLIAWMVSPRNL